MTTLIQPPPPPPTPPVTFLSGEMSDLKHPPTPPPPPTTPLHSSCSFISPINHLAFSLQAPPPSVRRPRVGPRLWGSCLISEHDAVAPQVRLNDVDWANLCHRYLLVSTSAWKQRSGTIAEWATGAGILSFFVFCSSPS